MPQCQFPVFCCSWFQKVTYGNILGIARNKRPGPYFSSTYTESEGETKRSQEPAKPHGGAVGPPAVPAYGLGPSGLPSVYSSVFWNLPGKIGTLTFRLSNSENISLTTFLKPKTAENRQLALWHLVNRLVPENA